jgi:hypothetical protein
VNAKPSGFAHVRKLPANDRRMAHALVEGAIIDITIQETASCGVAMQQD